MKKSIIAILLTLAAQAIGQIDPNMPTIIATAFEVMTYEDATGQPYIVKLAEAWQADPSMKTFAEYARFYGSRRKLTKPKPPKPPESVALLYAAPMWNWDKDIGKWRLITINDMAIEVGDVTGKRTIVSTIVIQLVNIKGKLEPVFESQRVVDILEIR